jgi:hypothetical protein
MINILLLSVSIDVIPRVPYRYLVTYHISSSYILVNINVVIVDYFHFKNLIFL